MHYSAKRGIEVVWLSVRPSVTLVDQWKLIARTISPTPSLFVAQSHPPIPGEGGEILGRLEVGCEKANIEHTAAGVDDISNISYGTFTAALKQATRLVPFQINFGCNKNTIWQNPDLIGSLGFSNSGRAENLNPSMSNYDYWRKQSTSML